MVTEVKGNLLEANVDVICHQVNCQGAMRSGIAKAIREKYPSVYECYMEVYKVNKENLLGNAQFVPVDDKIIVNMFSQENYGYDGKRYTSYDAFWQCLGDIKNNIPEDKSIGFPKNIGCCRGGANWEVIRTMIKEVLGNREVYIYELNVG